MTLQRQYVGCRSQTPRAPWPCKEDPKAQQSKYFATSRTLSRTIHGKRSTIKTAGMGSGGGNIITYCGDPIIDYCSEIGNAFAPYSIQPDRVGTLLTLSRGGTCSFAYRSRNAINVTDPSGLDVSAAPNIDVTSIVVCLRSRGRWSCRIIAGVGTCT